MLTGNDSCRRIVGTGVRYSLAESCPSDRLAVERFIGERFAAAYGARLTSFMPRLLALRTTNGELVGACGLRSASQRLFVERYLDQPIEEAIGQELGITVERQQIVEVGQFAGVGAGAARAIILHLTASLFGEGVRRVTFTGTARLRNAFHRLGLEPIDIAVADPARLARDEQLQWGSYYHCQPRVQFGNIAEGFGRLTQPPPARTAQA